MPAAFPSALAPRCTRRRPTTRLRKHAALGESCPQDQYAANPIVLACFARPRLSPRDARSVAIQDISPKQFARHLGEHATHKAVEVYAAHRRLQVFRDITRAGSSVAFTLADRHQHHPRSVCESLAKDALSVRAHRFEAIEPPVANQRVAILCSRERIAKQGAPIGPSDDNRISPEHSSRQGGCVGTASASKLDDALPGGLQPSAPAQRAWPGRRALRPWSGERPPCGRSLP